MKMVWSVLLMSIFISTGCSQMGFTENEFVTQTQEMKLRKPSTKNKKSCRAIFKIRSSSVTDNPGIKRRGNFVLLETRAKMKGNGKTPYLAQKNAQKKLVHCWQEFIRKPDQISKACKNIQGEFPKKSLRSWLRKYDNPFYLTGYETISVEMTTKNNKEKGCQPQAIGRRKKKLKGSFVFVPPKDPTCAFGIRKGRYCAPKACKVFDSLACIAFDESGQPYSREASCCPASPEYIHYPCSERGAPCSLSVE